MGIPAGEFLCGMEWGHLQGKKTGDEKVQMTLEERKPTGRQNASVALRSGHRFCSATRFLQYTQQPGHGHREGG